jgi:hypothetical protein
MPEPAQKKEFGFLNQISSAKQSGAVPGRSAQIRI